jgi:hypothetical protein
MSEHTLKNISGAIYYPLTPLAAILCRISPCLNTSTYVMDGAINHSISAVPVLFLLCLSYFLLFSFHYFLFIFFCEHQDWQMTVTNSHGTTISICLSD